MQLLPRAVFIALAILLTAACSAPPPRGAAAPPPDPTKEPWYAETTAQMAAMADDAESDFRRNRVNEAAAIVERCRPLMDRLLSAPQPTLAAMQAVSDVDQLYGEMLLLNGHYTWARDCFQKNLVRWKSWKPASSDSLRRMDLALSRISECERREAAR